MFNNMRNIHGQIVGCGFHLYAVMLPAGRRDQRPRSTQTPKNTGFAAGKLLPARGGLTGWINVTLAIASIHG
jgi:hypothetical protein